MFKLPEHLRIWLKPSALIAAVPLIVFLSLAIINLSYAEKLTNLGKSFAINYFGGTWLWLTLLTLFISVLVAISPLGNIKLGGNTAKPSLGIFEWCSVLICTLLAGGGVFWSAAEPLLHFLNPPSYFSNIEGETELAVDSALATSFLHWGFLAWALVGSTVAITFSLLAQRGYSLRPRSLLIPISSEKFANGIAGDLADGLSVVAAIAGTVGPLGFLSLQLSNAAGRLPNLDDSAFLQISIVLFLTSIFSISTFSGIQKGIKFLSELNIWLTIFLAFGLFLIGPTFWLVKHFSSGFILYFKNFISMSIPDDNDQWVKGWTIFYWGWFLGYAPLMGLFTAGISKGRRIKELIFIIAFVCPLVTNIWFTILGGNGLFLELNNTGLIKSELSTGGSAAVLFAILKNLPLSGLFIFIALLLIILFMATSADSISYATAMVISGKELPPKRLRLFWALMIGFLTIALLQIGGRDDAQTSIDALQSFIVLTAVPVTPLLIISLYSAPKLAYKEYKLLMKNKKQK